MTEYAPPPRPRFDALVADLEAARTDAFVDLVTGMGTDRDNAIGGFYSMDRMLAYEEIEAVYACDGTAARLVDKVAKDAVKAGFDFVSGDSEVDAPGIEQRLEQGAILQRLGEAKQRGNLYGTGYAIMLVEDGLPADRPLDYSRVQYLRDVIVADCTHMLPDPDSVLGSVLYPETYTVHAVAGSAPPKKVHASRVIRFDGIKLPPRMSAQYFNGCGMSVIQRSYKEIVGLSKAMQMLDHMLLVTSSMVLGVSNLQDWVRGDAAKGREALANIAKLHNAYRIFLTDKEHSFTELTRNVSGIVEIVEQRINSLVRSSNQPRLVILGESPHGLNASGKDEDRTFKETVASVQEDEFTPAVNRILEVIFAAYRNIGLESPTSWEIRWLPISLPTDIERAQARLTNAQARSVDATGGAVPLDRIMLDPDIDNVYPTTKGDRPNVESGATPSLLSPEQEAALGLAPPNPVIPPNARLVTISQAATATGFSAGQIGTLIRRGPPLGIASYQLATGGRRMVDLNEVWQKVRVIGPKPAPQSVAGGQLPPPPDPATTQAPAAPAVVP